MLKKLKNSLAVLAVFCTIGSAQATPLSVNNAYKNGQDYYAGLAWSNSFAGAAVLWNVRNVDDDSRFLAFCIEPYQPAVADTHDYTASAFFEEQVQELYDRHYDGALQGKTQAIAFQMALWQLVGGPMASDFQHDLPGQIAVAMLEDVFHDADPFTRKYTLTRWSNDQYQDILQALALPSMEVPEPASAALVLGGLAVMVLVSRRKKKFW